MKIAFEFNDGESAQQIVSAILGLFGAAASVPGNVNVITAGISPQDNPANGADDVEDAPGTPTTATHDSTGLAYDARIHSTPPALTDKKVWRKKRGAPKTLIAQVEAELRATKPAPAPSAPAPAPAVNTLPIPGAGVTPLPGLPTLAPAQPSDYEKLVQFLAGHMHSPSNPTGRLTEEYISNCFKQWGIVDAAGNGSLQALQNDTPERIATVRGTFAQALGLPANS